ncbi:profilin-2-like [Sceloporus undulatus]|uniref:profilin-2-like n=1 Tax=Sceloporus undulatus TaxID=8520 RepID=UPI001C4AF259|nr:profilin-2-like [Sceloporus undulatus]
MTVWQQYIHNFVRAGMCWDAAVVSIAQQQLLIAHQGGILARMTKAEIEALLGRNRDILLTEGLTLGGLKCLVIRDNLYADAHYHTMELRTKLVGDNGTRAIAVVLVNPVCLILIGEKGIQGGTLSLKAFQTAQSIKENYNNKTAW